MNCKVRDIVELLNGEYREVIGLTDNGLSIILDDETKANMSDIDHVLSDEEVSDLAMDHMSDV